MRERQATWTLSVLAWSYWLHWRITNLSSSNSMVLFSIKKKNHEIRSNVFSDKAFSLALYYHESGNCMLGDPLEQAYYVCGHLWWDPHETCESGATTANPGMCWLMLLSWVRKFFIPTHEPPVFCQYLWNNSRLPFRLVVKQFKTLQSSWHGYYTNWIIATAVCDTMYHKWKKKSQQGK